MKKEQLFMMIFRFTPELDHQPTPEEKVQMQEQWGSFIGHIAIQEKLVSTHQLGFEGKQIHPNLDVTHSLFIQEQQTLGGNMIVKAHSLEEATEMAKASPILSMGGTVEVRNILPMNL